MTDTWTISEPRTLTFDGDVGRLRVRTVAGAVNVVAAQGPARLEVTSLDGAPLLVTLDNGELTVSYEDLQWKDFSWKSLGLLIDRWRRRRHAVVSLAVPASAAVELGSAGCDVVISGLAGRTVVHGATGDTTLLRLSGPVEVNTVSGGVQAHGVSGDLKVNTVSGSFTLVEGSGARVHGNTVNGAVAVDLDDCDTVVLNTVSGEVAVRLPHPADADVRADTTSGEVSSAFEELRVSGMWGAKRITGKLGEGSGKLRISTVSGSVALLRRPTEEDPTEEDHV